MTSLHKKLKRTHFYYRIRHQEELKQTVHRLRQYRMTYFNKNFRIKWPTTPSHRLRMDGR